MNFLFTPVNVTGGRKFKGFAYYFGQSSRTGGYGWSCTTDKLWDPKAKKYVYASDNFVTDAEGIQPEQVEADKAEFIKYIIEDTKRWCASVKPNAAESEILSFARNVVRKHWPALSEAELAAHGLGDQREACSEVMKTLEWAMGLKTRACWMYGKWCPGGRPLAEQTKMNIARKSIVRKGLNRLKGYEASLTMALTLMGLMKYYDLFIDKN